MKKIISYIVLLTLLSLNSLNFVSASYSDNIQVDKISSIKLLDNIENSLDKSLDGIQAKTKDNDIKYKIEEKQKEIEDYINQKQAEIKQENSSSDIKEIIDETKNVVTLKAVAGVTPTTDVTDNISSQIDVSKKDLGKAEDTLINSLETEDGYTLVLKTKLTSEEVLSKLTKYDANIKINNLFSEDENNFYELNISKDSLLRQELLEDVDSGEVPNNLLGIEVVKPELLKIGDISTSGEETDKLWGINKYGITKYSETIKNQTSKNTKKIRVGIIDTGITFTHPDLKNEISKNIAGYDFVNDDNDPTDDQGHGTHVAGTIAGEINGAGVYGVNPNVELVGLKICDSSGFCPIYGVLKALEYAKDKKLDVLNMSLGAKGNVYTSPVCQAIKDITENGTVVVAAAGNSNVNTSTFVPGGCIEAVTVGAVDENLNRASFSNYGDKVDVSAPGVGIYSSYLNNGYKSLNGTSMATPHIVGIVSILKTYNPSITTKEVKEIFKKDNISLNTESNKKIASFVDVDKMMKDLGVEINSQVVKSIDSINNDEKVQEVFFTGSENVDTNISSGSENIDNQNNLNLEINAVTKAKELTIPGFNASKSILETDSFNFAVYSGNGKYTASSSDNSVAVVYIDYTSGKGTISSLKPGKTTIIVKDILGKSTSLELYVLPLLKNIEYTPSIEEFYVGGIYYEVESSSILKETGVEFRYFDINKKITKQGTQTIPKNTDINDKSYASFIVPNCTSSCELEIRPYFKTTSNIIVYKNSGAWGKITYGKQLLTSTNSVKIANSGEEELENGYIGDEIGNKEEYKSENIIDNEEIISESDNSDENIGESVENEYSGEGVEVNAIPLLIILIRIGLAGITLYDTYNSINSCNDNGYLSRTCLVDSGLSFIPIKGGKQAKNILGFSSKNANNGNKVVRYTKIFANDSLTVLKDTKKYQKTNYTYHNANVYKEISTGNYYYRDNFHKTHLEVFNKQGKHLGEANPETGIIIIGTADRNKIFKP